MEKKRIGRPADKRGLTSKGIPVRLPKEHARILRGRADLRDIPVAELVREAVAAYLEED